MKALNFLKKLAVPLVLLSTAVVYGFLAFSKLSNIETLLMGAIVLESIMHTIEKREMNARLKELEWKVSK